MSENPGPDAYATSAPPGAPGPPAPGGVRGLLTTSMMSDLAQHWGLVVAYGVLTLVLGIILAAWPGETLVVCAVLIAIQFIFSGVLRVVMAILAPGAEGGLRILNGLLGAFSLLVGLLVLRDPVQTLTVIGILLGAWWLIAGVAEILGAVLSPVHERRGWDALVGVVSILAGGFLLIDPSLSLGVLVVVIAIWLFAIGLLAIVTGLRLRALQRSGRRPSAKTEIPPAPAM